MWFRGIRASDTRLRSASAFQPPLPVHPLLLILSLASLLPSPLTEFLSSPQTTPAVFTLLKSISKVDGSLLEFLQRLPKANSWKLSSQTFMTLFLWHLNVAHVSRLEDNLGSLWKADLWASPKGVIIQYQVQDPGFLSSPWGLPCGGWSTPGGALPFHPTAWKNSPWVRSLHCLPQDAPGKRSLPAPASCLISTAHAQPHSLKAPRAFGVLPLLSCFQVFLRIYDVILTLSVYSCLWHKICGCWMNNIC